MFSCVLVSQMDGDQYVPIWTVANFNQASLRRNYIVHFLSHFLVHINFCSALHVVVIRIQLKIIYYLHVFIF